jgi:hypothetical protein
VGKCFESQAKNSILSTLPPRGKLKGRMSVVTEQILGFVKTFISGKFRELSTEKNDDNREATGRIDKGC